MKDDHISTGDKYLLRLLLFIILFFVLLRFINFDADFPQGITTSTVLYTDEGWYSNAAINFIITGRWYIPGDPNLIVNQPVGQIIQLIMFSVFGMSLSTARLTIVLFFILLVIFTYLLSLRYSNKIIATYICLFLSVNYTLFAYSRLAILEIMMLSFAVLSLLVLSGFRRTNGYVVAGFGSIILVIAYLTKNTAVFALPLLMFLASTRGKGKIEQITLAVFSGLVFVILVSGYNFLAESAYPEDFALFMEGNFYNRTSFVPSAIIENALDALGRGAKIIEPVVYILSLLLIPFILIHYKKSNHNTLVTLSVLWLVSYFGILSLTSYHPTRYFLPLFIPISILLSYGVYYLREKAPVHISIIMQLIVIAYLLISNGGRIADYILNPEFTFVNMARDVEKIILERCQCNGRDEVLIGPLSNTVGMEIGIRSFHPSGPRTLEWKLETYKPRFYIALGKEGGDVKTINEKFNVRQLSEWDVFHNYSGKRKVYLFEIQEKVE